MFEWTIFYRLLNLPDDVATPTYYHLLGLKPHSCTAEAVKNALQERKKRLRQNIPGPHFIPLVLRFETEQLDPAAEILANPKGEIGDSHLFISMRDNGHGFVVMI